MTITNQNGTMWQGESKTIIAPITKAGTPQSLTGADVTWLLVTGAGAVVITKAAAAGNITLSTTTAANDTLNITLLPADTATLAAGVYNHLCVVTDSAGAVSVVFAGHITLIGRL